MKTQLVVPAAGMGSRLGSKGPKALVELAGRAMLACTLERFAVFGLAQDAVITVPSGWKPAFESVLREAFGESRRTLIEGGAERQDSVWNALQALAPDTELVLIHDAARPFISPESIAAVMEAAETYGAATVAIPSTDTILVADDEQCLLETPDRQRLWACQTPQAFRVEVIRQAHLAARVQGTAVTDDATLVRLHGGRVRLAMGSPLNFKITTPADLRLAECVMEARLA